LEHGARRRQARSVAIWTWSPRANVPATGLQGAYRDKSRGYRTVVMATFCG
jgi:hypothetical protein